MEWNYLELSDIPDGAASLPDKERRKLYTSLTKTFRDDDPIQPNLGSMRSIPLSQEIKAINFYLLVVVLPMAMVPFTLALLLSGVWNFLACWMVCLAILAIIPINPLTGTQAWIQSSLLTNLYRYSSFKIVWTDEALAVGNIATVGSGGPHGVFPIGSVLAVPAINEYLGINFVGAAASILSKVPGLRFVTSLGVVDVGKQSILAAIKRGSTVGIVHDGISGMFALASANDDTEVLAIRDKKGICKLCLTLGTSIHVVHWFGNSEVLTPITDSFGILEFISRKLRVSLMFFTGRFLLPLPRRTPILMAIGKPVIIEQKVEKPTQTQIDEVHERLLAHHAHLFESLKKSYGAPYNTRKLVIP